jgi:hypothetical protein
MNHGDWNFDGKAYPNNQANSDGCGQVYVYDAIGSYKQVAVATLGTGREVLQPILDRLLACTQQRIVQGTADRAIQTLCEAYRSVSEREIGVGDNLVLHVTERRGQEVESTCVLKALPSNLGSLMISWTSSSTEFPPKDFRNETLPVLALPWASRRATMTIKSRVKTSTFQ